MQAIRLGGCCLLFNGTRSELENKSATTKLMHRSNDEAMSSFRQACGLQSPGGYLIAEFWA